MTIAMSEQVDAEPCDVLRGGDGPVYFLLGGQLYVVHEILGRWIEPDVEPRRRLSRRVPTQGQPGMRRATAQETATGTAATDPAVAANPAAAAAETAAGAGTAAAPETAAGAGTAGAAGTADGETREPAQVEHWLVVASVGRFGTPGVFRLQRRPAPPANGPDNWTVRAEKR